MYELTPADTITTSWLRVKTSKVSKQGHGKRRYARTGVIL